MLYTFFKQLKLILIIFSLLFFAPNNCFAHHGGECNVSGPGLSGPIITIPAYTLPKGEKYFGAGINYTNFNTFSDSRLINSVLIFSLICLFINKTVLNIFC